MDRAASAATVSGIGAGSMIDSRYHLSRILERGAAAELWRAVDLRLRRDVAVRLCRLDCAARHELARANALAGVTHPALATIFDGGIHRGPDGDHVYVVTELIDGQSLRDRLAYGPLPPRRIARIGSQLADALAHLHRHGAHHGSVSLANVVLLLDGSAKLADLSTDSCDAAGSPADDVRALARILLAAFAGVPAMDPAKATSRWVWRRRRVTTAEAGRPRNAEWHELLSAMVADDPAARPTAAEVAGRLAGLSTAPVATARERDEPGDVNDDVAPLSIGDWRAPYARGGSSRSRVRLRGGRHRRAAAAQPAAPYGDDAAA